MSMDADKERGYGREIAGFGNRGLLGERMRNAAKNERLKYEHSTEMQC